MNIPKDSSLKEISLIIQEDTLIKSYLIPYSFSILLGYEKKLNFGEFEINKDNSLFNLLQKIKKGEAHRRKMTIIEGFDKYQFFNLIDKSFLKKNDFIFEDYNLIAETFFYTRNQEVSDFLKDIDNFTIDYLNKYNKKNNFSNEEILIISSLVEKEALDDEDRRLISSVIFNRLKNNMKLDIDASVIYSITKGNYKMKRMLNLTDLKINDPYNTYRNKGLPPGPICIPGYNTLKIVLENHKSPYFYYFFDENKNSHIFSKSYKDHLNKLNEYREKKL